MAVIEDLLTEWRKLNTPGKVAVGGVVLAVIIIGYALTRNRSASTGTASIGGTQGDNAGYSPFTITSAATGTPVSTPKPPVTLPPLGRIARGIVKPVKITPAPPPRKIPPIGPARPIPFIAQVQSAVSKWQGGIFHSTGGITSNLANPYAGFTGTSGIAVRPAPHPIEYIRPRPGGPIAS